LKTKLNQSFLRWVLAGEPVVRSATSAYAERPEEEPPWHDRIAAVLNGRLLQPLAARVRDPARGLERVVALTKAYADGYRTAGDEQLLQMARPLRADLRRHGFSPELVARSFALVREVAARTIGQRHFDVQLMGAWALLQGRLVEMATGEGKTLTASLAVCTAALAGTPVHVITVNDYLAERDAEAMGPIYRFLGLTTGVVKQGVPAGARRQAYGCDIAYCTNKELAFDYLRDRVALGRSGGRLNMAVEALRDSREQASPLLLRGLHFGIVDEADSVFIDEARTPLILSATIDGTHELEMYRTALAFAQRMQAGQDYRIDERARRVELTDAGKARVGELAGSHPGVWTSLRGREELVTQGLTALLLFARDKQYVVSDGKVQIVDEFTGRIMADRSWELGLHQMIEAKEECELSAQRETLARITYQRLFRRYMRLAGMTGTAQEVSQEVWSVYRLRTVTMPLNRPSARRYLPGRLYAGAAEQWQAVADTAKIAAAQGRAVLIGTQSVDASEKLSAVLARNGIEHALLNAKQDRDEAAVVADAGQAGRVTVATNMAGRGTDIRLGPGVAERGGLHVILTECHASARVDRQLFGRGARQGDPGSCETVLSLDDELLRVFAAPLVALSRRLVPPGRPAGSWLLELLRGVAQARAERHDARIRRDTLKQNLRMEKTLAFSGRHE
jgi:preprotein translocase subunit SecA